MCQGCLRLLSFLEWVWAGRLSSWGNVQSTNRKGKGLWDSPAVAEPEASRHRQAATCFTSLGSLLEWELEGVQRAPALLQLQINTRGGKWVTELPSEAAVWQHMSLPGKVPRVWLVVGQNRVSQSMFQQDRQLNFTSVLRNSRATNYSLEAKVSRTRNICPPIFPSLRRHCFFRSYRKIQDPLCLLGTHCGW